MPISPARKAIENLSLTPQNKLILEFLRSGRTLTNLIALTTMGIGSLTKRISELRALGYRIEVEDREDFRGRKYRAYTLV